MRLSILSISFIMSLGLFIPLSEPVQQIDYQQKWSAVDSLEQLGLYRSALKQVDRIYEYAKKQDDADHEIKALIFRLKYTNVLLEDGYQEVIKEMEKEKDDVRHVPRAIKYSMLGELYTRYYNSNRWRIFNNTDIDSDDKANPETWSPSRFGRYIDELYQESLKDSEKLDEFYLDDYKEIFTRADTSGVFSVFDLLASRALDFYKMEDLDYSRDPLPGFLMDSTLLATRENFLSWFKDLDRGDSFQSRALKIYYELIISQENKNKDYDILMADLARLNYAYSIYLGDNADLLKTTALDNLYSTVLSDSSKAAALYEKADFYRIRSSGYKINSAGNEKYENDRKTAVDLAQRAAELAPGSIPAKKSRNLITGLTAPRLKPVLEIVSLPNRHIQLSLEYANLDELWYWITPVSPQTTIKNPSNNRRRKWDVFAEGNSPVAKGKFILPDRGDYNNHRLTADLAPLLAGNYQLLISDKPDPENEDGLVCLTHLRISDIAWMSNVRDDGSLELFVVDRGSGLPLEGIRVKQFFRIYDNRSGAEELMPGKEFVSDADGLVEIRAEANGSIRNSSFFLMFGPPDIGIMSSQSFHLYNRMPQSRKKPFQRIYTDRGIYRPGQDVLFSGLLVSEDEKDLVAEKDYSLDIYFQDSKYKNLDTLKLKTDAYGFFTGAFSIPEDALSGPFRIRSDCGTYTIKVEQYKRPNFKIFIDKDSRVYYPGDTIYISGRAEAFAGSPLSGGEVELEAYFNFSSYGPSRFWFLKKNIRIDKEKLRLNEDGSFKWAVKSEEFLKNESAGASYEFKVKVKDLNGETHEVNSRVSVRSRALTANINGLRKLDYNDPAEWNIRMNSTDGRAVKSDVIVEIGLLNEPDKRAIRSTLPEPDTWIIKEKVWRRIFPRVIYKADIMQDSVANVVFKREYSIDEQGLEFKPELMGMENGRYRIIVRRADAPEIIIGKFEFDRYNSRRKSFPVRDPIWISTDERQYRPGETMEYQLGSRYPGMYQLEISGMDTVYISQWIHLDNRLKRKDLLIDESMMGNLQIQLYGVYENRGFTKQELVKVPWLGKDLYVHGLEDIRDYEPGEEAEISILIKDEEGSPVMTRGVVTVYDASLDELAELNWSPYKWPTLRVQQLIRRGDLGSRQARIIQNVKLNYIDIPVRLNPSLNWFGMTYYGISRRGNMEMAMQPAARDLKAAVAEEGAGNEETIFYSTDEDAAEQGLAPATKPLPGDETGSPPYFRKDFRETAYFNGDFSTGDNGLGTIRFSVPEALTGWNIKIYGHDGELAQLNTEADFKSKKALMLLPNFPRFLRERDNINFNVKLSYGGEENLSCISGINILDQKGNIIHNEERKINIEPNEQIQLTWNFVVPLTSPSFEIQFYAKAGDYSDGVSKLIPVLPGELSFWEAKNFMLFNPVDRKISSAPGIERAFLELNTQPIWLAAKAIPDLRDKDLPCSELWYSRYFTAKLIRKISTEYPQIREKIVEIAAEIDANPDLNQFLRNDDIRSFVLDEGLWEGSAEAEAARIKALAEAFNPDVNSKEISRSLDELIDLQLPGGGWPWFRGMRPDFRMSMHILGGLGELMRMESRKVQSQDMNQMIGKAIAYIDNTMAMRYSRFRIIESEKDPPLTADLINYLYVRSFFLETALNKDHREAYDYYFKKAGEDWLNYSLSQQAFIAITYLRSGDKKFARTVMNSLLDRKLESDEGGIYWKTDRVYTYWNERDIWQQARIVEFLNMVPGQEENIDAVRSWLIQQKRSRDWGDRISTAMALKSLILYGSDWTTSKPQISFDSGGEHFSPLRIDLGSNPVGEYRYSWEEIPEQEALNIRIKKTDRSPVYGSLLIKTTSGLDTLQASGEDLKIKRLILRESEIEGKPVWTVADNGSVRAGERIKIRLEVEADQAIDYVQLRDYRPAAFEPDQSFSGYRWGNGTAWSQAYTDSYFDFYIAKLPKGLSIFEYDLYAEQAGSYSMGYAEIQSHYAPEFIALSDGGRLTVKMD